MYIIPSGCLSALLHCMMSIHTTVKESGLYYITYTCFQWINLFEITKSYDLVYNWFDYLTSKGESITAYVIMPNHLHVLLHHVASAGSINTIVGNAKRFMAYEIVRRLQSMAASDVLLQLSQPMRIRQSKAKNHRVWEDSFDIKLCHSKWFTHQKLNYIHANPCRGKWNLAPDYHLYVHSSASFYVSGQATYQHLKDYRIFLS